MLATLKCCDRYFCNGVIAQLVERLNGIQKVGGSIPPGSTKPVNVGIRIMDQATIQKGKGFLNNIIENAGDKIEKGYKDIDPTIADNILGYIFGTLYQRGNLDLKTRQIVTITALACHGFAKPQLEYHIKLGLSLGLTKEEIIEIFVQLSGYHGFPVMLNGLATAREVFEQLQQPK